MKSPISYSRNFLALHASKSRQQYHQYIPKYNNIKVKRIIMFDWLYTIDFIINNKTSSSLIRSYYLFDRLLAIPYKFIDKSYNGDEMLMNVIPENKTQLLVIACYNVVTLLCDNDYTEILTNISNYVVTMQDLNEWTTNIIECVNHTFEIITPYNYLLLQYDELSDIYICLLVIAILQELPCKYNPQQIAEWVIKFASINYEEWTKHENSPVYLSLSLDVVIKLKELVGIK
jgi:hypothetical protein